MPNAEIQFSLYMRFGTYHGGLDSKWLLLLSTDALLLQLLSAFVLLYAKRKAT
jgi:hypothetical protein